MFIFIKETNKQFWNTLIWKKKQTVPTEMRANYWMQQGQVKTEEKGK